MFASSPTAGTDVPLRVCLASASVARFHNNVTVSVDPKAGVGAFVDSSTLNRPGVGHGPYPRTAG